MNARLMGGIVVVGLVAGVLASGQVVSNAFSMLTSKSFYIPNESSVMTFRVTLPNPGSGEWWLYGEDDTNYYALSDDDHYTYLVLPKDAAAKIDPLDKSTWSAFRLSRSEKYGEK